MNSVRRRGVRAALGVALAAAALYAATTKVDWRQFAAALRAVDAAWILVALASVLVTLGLVTWRWGTLVGRSGPPGGRDTGRTRGLWDAVVIGQAINIVVPLRFGEAARVAITCTELTLRVGRVTVAMALERALDVGVFAAAVVAIALTGAMPAALHGVLTATTALVLGAAAIVVAVVRIVPWGLRRLHGAVERRGRIAAWLLDQDASIRAEWRAVRVERQPALLLLLTVLLFLTSASTNLLVFHAFRLAVPAVAAVVLLVVLQVGTAVVSVPGNVGVFHYLTVLTLAQWGVDRDEALAAAVVLHVVSLGPKVLLGAAAGLAARRRRAADRGRDARVGAPGLAAEPATERRHE